ncbi:hypothetical protein LEN26_021261 [Aphanomyces euteiches]|nr:hypothetical protein LEN26_021261 [Aphanomyces euteiches]KAH9124762.1 hypothetical protein AeMF1_004521 [Aphanomyces euteiches]KAH9182488.1 hypothetical protein AeNC1_015536 [Aphanomyces euteiches]
MAPLLPSEILTKIARYVPDNETLFALLDVFHSMEVLDTFQHLWELGRVLPRSQLWPDLRLTALDPSFRIHAQAVQSLFSHVELVNMFDLEIVSTAASISIEGCPFPSE